MRPRIGKSHTGWYFSARATLALKIFLTRDDGSRGQDSALDQVVMGVFMRLFRRFMFWWPLGPPSEVSREL